MTVGPVDPVAIALPSRYRLVRALGSGGMATVHLAEDALTGRQVAVKVLRHDLAGAVAIERFLLEVRVTQELRHPHVIPLLDAGAVDGIPYLVMPYVAGVTLQQRLRRERQLPLPEAVRIVRAVSGALTLAHAHGFLHRDVKPANVLLDGEQVFLTDFGIARAIQRSATDQLTLSGISIGTAGYMSPEQATGDPTLDGRADQYALACVAYEMLAGEPPFTGPTGREVIAKQLSLVPPSVRVIRPALPEAVDAVLHRALEKVPADRYPTVQAFEEAFEEASRQPPGTSVPSGTAHPVPGTAATGGATGTGVPAPWWRRSPAVAGVGALSLALAGTLTARELGVLGDGLPRLSPADSVRYAVMPIRAAGETLPAVATDAVRAALAQWTDLEVVDEARVREALADEGAATPAEPSEEARAARRLRAGRYVRGEVVAAPAGPVMRLRLVDAVARDSVVGEVEAVLAAGLGTDASMRGVVSLVERLLVGDVPEGAGTRVLAARRAHATGAEALRRFALQTAESAFVAAVAADERFAAAHLGLALARHWSGDEPARWRINVGQAAVGRATLTVREQRIAVALEAALRDDAASSCDAWRTLVADDTLDVVARLGVANCVVDDDVVLPDPRSPSGWRFRTSYRDGMRHYMRAFELEPRILEAFGGEAMESLRRLFRTSANHLRFGRAAPPSPLRFTANIERLGDSVGFVPVPRARGAPHVVRDYAARNAAIRLQRELMLEVASSWVATSPRSADAHHAVANALAALGDPSALVTLERARAFAATLEERGRVATAELALRLAFAVRDLDTVAVRRSRRLADSLFSSTAATDPRGLALRASIAALTGRADEAVRLAANPALAPALGAPASLREGARELLVLSALGGPQPALRRFEERVALTIARAFPPEEQGALRMQVLARAASMAFPIVRSPLLDSLANDDELVALQVALQRGDTAMVRAGLEGIRLQRRGGLPEARTLDALTPEAALWLALGDAREAADWLDPTLGVLPQVEPSPLRSPVAAASLARALALRAEAARRLGDDSTARRAAAALDILWSRADDGLREAIRAPGTSSHPPSEPIRR